MARAQSFLTMGLLVATALAGEGRAVRRVFVAALASPDGKPGRERGAAVEAAIALVSRHVAACRRDGALVALLPALDELLPYLDSRPADRAEVRRLLRAGRLATTGALAAAAHRLVGDEAFLRSIVAGRLRHERALGTPPTIYVVRGDLGSSPQLSQILAGAGYKGCFWTGPVGRGPRAFWHLSPSGARLFHCRVGEAVWAESAEELRRLVGSAATSAAGPEESVSFRLVAPGPAGPRPFLVGEAAKLREGDPEVVLASPNAYLEAALPRAGAKSRVPTISRCVSSRRVGAAVSRVELKIANRLCETTLADAECFATIASLLGAGYPRLALDKAWRQVLAAHRHDAITGAGGQATYLDTLSAYRESLELASGALRRSLRYLGRAIHTTARPGVPIAAFNPLGWKRNGVCRTSVDVRGLRVRGIQVLDDQGKPVPFEVTRLTKSADGQLQEARLLFVATDVPPVGFRLFHVAPAEALPTAPVTEEAPTGTIENEFFRLSVDADLGGGMVRLLDKATRREVIRPVDGRVGNEIVALREAAGRKDAASQLHTTGALDVSSRHPSRLEIRSGPVAMQIVATGRLGAACQRRQTITLTRGVRRIDCETRLTYRGTDDLFVVSFPIRIPGTVPLIEDRFCVQTCRRSRRPLDYRTADEASGCRVRAAANWAGVGTSVRIAFADREARIIGSFHLGPSTIVHADDPAGRRAALFLQRVLAPRGIACATALDTWPPRSIDTPFRVAVSVAGRNAYARKLLGTLDEAGRGALAARVKAQGHALAVLRDLAVPAGERAATALVVLVRGPEELDKALDDIAANIETTTGITVPASANFAGIRATAPDYGVAILNQGTLAHSFEPDGRLVLFLMHTAGWPSTRLARPLVPERGARLFRYALYPHAADWREARVYRAARELNHPLLPLVLDRHDGPLRAPTSFLSVEPDNIVLGSVRPAGLPTLGGAPAAAGGRGVLLRLHEAWGEGPIDARLRFFAPIKEAWRADLLGERGPAIEPAGNEVTFKIGPAAIRAIELVPESIPAQLPPVPLDTTAEPVKPVFSRYWRHNVAAAPLGDQPVAITVDGELRVGQRVDVRVAVANNTAGRLEGTVWLAGPEAWKVAPARFDYRLAPRGHVVRTVSVSVPANAPSGVLAALTQHGGQTYRDMAVAGEYKPLELTVQRAAARIVARILNPNPFDVSGQAEVISALEAWPRELVGPYSQWAVGPRVQAFTARAEAETSVAFLIEPAAPQAWQEGFWAVIKLAYDGRVAYAAEPQGR